MKTVPIINLPDGSALKASMSDTGMVDWPKTIQRVWNKAVTYMVIHSKRSGYLDMAAIERDLKRQGISNPFLDWVRFLEDQIERGKVKDQ